MDGLALVSEAMAAGLTVRVDGDRLVIRGPKAADAVARRLLEHKPEVVAALGRFGVTPTEFSGRAESVTVTTTPVKQQNNTGFGDGDNVDVAHDGDELSFPGWVLRPEVDGKMGWERPGIPEADRW